MSANLLDQTARLRLPFVLVEPIDATHWWTFPGTGSVDGIHVEYIEHATTMSAFGVDHGRAGPQHVRVEIVGLYITGHDLNSGGLREILLGRLESQIAMAVSSRAPVANAVSKTSPLSVNELKAREKELRAEQGARQHEDTTSAKRDEIQDLLSRKPDDAPDDFYVRVARAYHIATSMSRSPAVLMADQVGGEVRTVHFWVREARRRGFLPPGRKGKAG